MSALLFSPPAAFNFRNRQLTAREQGVLKHALKLETVRVCMCVCAALTRGAVSLYAWREAVSTPHERCLTFSCQISAIAEKPVSSRLPRVRSEDVS